jgi:hypothetical protein
VGPYRARLALCRSVRPAGGTAARPAGRARGCIGSFLDTFSFQARPFYEKQGYTVFGRIENFPKGHTRFLLSKRWDS